MDALDVHVEQRVGVERRPGMLIDEAAHCDFVGALDRGEVLDHRRIIDMFAEKRQRGVVVENLFTADLAQQPGQPGLAWCSQRRKVMPLVLLTMRSG